MPEFVAHGLKLLWPDVGAPHPTGPLRVVVEALPASAANILRVVYSINGGPERAARAWPAGTNPTTQAQQFAAHLPSVPPGSQIDWRPVLSNGVRVADPKPKLKSRPEPDAPTPTRDINDRFPYELTFLARVTAPLAANPYAIGNTPDGLRIVFPLGEGGTVRGPRFNGKIDHIGGDWMRVREDGIGVTSIRALIQTDDGATVMSEYSGFADFGPDGQKCMAEGHPPPEVNLDLTPRYLSSDPRWDWLNRLQCVGFGKVTMSSLIVEYDLYAMQSLAAKTQGKVHNHG